MWSLSYFTPVFYVTLITSALLYLLPNLPLFLQVLVGGKITTFTTLRGSSLFGFLISLLILTLIVHSTWSGPSLTAWFGHTIFSFLQYKITYLLLFFFTTFSSVLLCSTYFSSSAPFDFFITALNFFVWTWMLFLSNNLFTFILVLEVLSVATTLLIVTSTFSSSSFYTNTVYASHEYFQSTTPLAFFQTLLFFFWVTLIASLALFLFLIFFYLKFLTFDWNVTEALVFYVITIADLQTLFSISFVWLVLLLCVFLKCGIVPFYLWKPTVFKGMSISVLFFYIYVYYFALFFFFLVLLVNYLHELFYFNIYVLLMFLIVGALVLTTILFESHYFKTFLALSSSLNSLLILFSAVGTQTLDVLFLI